MIAPERRAPGSRHGGTKGLDVTYSLRASECRDGDRVQKEYVLCGRTHAYRCARFFSAASYFLVKRWANSIRSSGGSCSTRRTRILVPSEVTSTSASGPKFSSSNISGGINRATEPPTFFNRLLVSISCLRIRIESVKQSLTFLGRIARGSSHPRPLPFCLLYFCGDPVQSACGYQVALHLLQL